MKIDVSRATTANNTRVNYTETSSTVPQMDATPSPGGDRVSLHGADPQDVLRALLRTKREDY